MKKTLDQTITEQQTLETTKGQVIIHCTFINTSQFGTSIGVRPNIQLHCPLSKHISQLVYAEGIQLRPRFKRVDGRQTLNFTLVFEGLPKEALYFDLVEPKIPRFIPWIIRGIPRNEVDVYEVRVY